MSNRTVAVKMLNDGKHLLSSLVDIEPAVLYTVEELAPVLRVKRRTLRNYCAERVFPNSLKIAGGRRWLIPGADVLALCPEVVQR